MKPAIVIFSHVVGLGVIRALGRMGVPVVAMHYRESEMAHLSRFVKERIRVPDPGKAETEFIAKLLDLSPRFKGSLLIPTDDFTVVALSRNKETLAGHYCVAAQEWDMTKRLIRKQHTYAFAQRLGIPCPATFIPSSLDDLRSRARGISYPCLVKPCEGHTFFEQFGAKMLKVVNEEDLLATHARVTSAGMKMMIQELIPGDDGQGVNYNSYFVDGAPIAEFTAKKVRIEPPFFGSPRVLVSRHIPEIVEPGRLLIKSLGYEGFSCMEFKKDSRDGIYKLMEINCRNNLTGSLAVRCGINFPWLMYRHLLYGEINPRSGFESDVFWIDIAHDCKRFFVSRKEEGYSLREYVKPYLCKKVFAVLSFTDPLPFLKRLFYFAQLGCRRIGRVMKHKGIRAKSAIDRKSSWAKGM
ncbi:MAG: hypothetical protein V1736_11980 [Pseudomonadota bacterium]